MKVKPNEFLPDGTLIDLNSYEWGDIKLLKKQKLFIIWYTLPGQEGFLNPLKASLKAGYSQQTAYHAKWQLLGDERIAELVKKFTDNFLKASYKEASQKMLDMKIKRASFDINKFYQTKTFENPETGQTVDRITIIPVDEISEENKCLIDNVEVNNQGIATYKLPNREKEINEIIKINQEMNQEKNLGEYDVETTVDIIRENLATVKTTVRLNNQRIKESAGDFIEKGENLPDYD